MIGEDSWQKSALPAPPYFSATSAIRLGVFVIFMLDFEHDSIQFIQSIQSRILSFHVKHYPRN